MIEGEYRNSVLKAATAALETDKVVCALPCTLNGKQPRGTREAFDKFPYLEEELFKNEISFGESFAVGDCVHFSERHIPGLSFCLLLLWNNSYFQLREEHVRSSIDHMEIILRAHLDERVAYIEDIEDDTIIKYLRRSLIHFKLFKPIKIDKIKKHDGNGRFFIKPK